MGWKTGKDLGACFLSLKTAMSLQEQHSQEHVWALKPLKPKDKQKAMKLNWDVGNEGSKCCSHMCRLLHRRGCSASAVPSGNCTLLTPCPVVLQHIPMPVLYGVFLHMGVAALNSIQVRGATLGVLVGSVLAMRGLAQYQLSLRSRAWILSLHDVQPGTWVGSPPGPGQGGTQGPSWGSKKGKGGAWDAEEHK